MIRVKVHPIGYKEPTIRPTKDHRGETVDYVQTIKMKNGQIRVIKHYKIYALGGLR